ncbi:hypothetical protein NDU88_007998 [Pleurodeles waltl]|uniref:Uncharacterized protein n=1 Tax=Pleurodeles waltl TaxID=8319 RepID=A0AAV7NUN6_PLEWA|nr:hypothetical protein NDU88_007998 [Pleurodeles waltl]
MVTSLLPTWFAMEVLALRSGRRNEEKALSIQARSVEAALPRSSHGCQLFAEACSGEQRYNLSFLERERRDRPEPIQLVSCLPQGVAVNGDLFSALSAEVGAAVFTLRHGTAEPHFIVEIEFHNCSTPPQCIRVAELCFF